MMNERLRYIAAATRTDRCNNVAVDGDMIVITICVVSASADGCGTVTIVVVAPFCFVGIYFS